MSASRRHRPLSSRRLPPYSALRSPPSGISVKGTSSTFRSGPLREMLRPSDRERDLKEGGHNEFVANEHPSGRGAPGDARRAGLGGDFCRVGARPCASGRGRQWWRLVLLRLEGRRAGDPGQAFAQRAAGGEAGSRRRETQRAHPLFLDRRPRRPSPIAVSGALYLPRGAPPEGGWPLLAWAHGTVGIADVCAPSWAGRSERDITYLNHSLDQGYAGGVR